MNGPLGPSSSASPPVVAPAVEDMSSLSAASSWTGARGWHAAPERVAWTVLTISFITFCILAITIPLSIRWFLLYSVAAEPARVDVLSGTVLVISPGAREPAGVQSMRKVAEGDTIRSMDARAILTIEEANEPEGVLTTVQLYNDTELTVERANRPRFARSSEPYKVELTLHRGRVRVLNLQPLHRALSVHVHTPQGQIDLSAGSFSIEVNGEEGQVTARAGQARVIAGGAEVALQAGERTILRKATPPSPPLPAAQNLLANGNFERDLDSWQVGTYQQSANVAPAAVQVVEVGGRKAVYFARNAEEGVHTEAWIEQTLDKDVLDFEHLTVRLDVRLMQQSLPGGGYLSSEFPVMVRLTYTDVYGKQLEWVQGFYFREPDPNSNWPIINGERIPQFVWYPYESPDLIQTLQATRPARLNAIRIYASGWNYQSMVSELGIIAR